jgi:MoaA/NifB/PqqE/SkfB family radical SAM enzyme
MQKVSTVKTVHIELTDKCQAQCPMCARNYHGGKTRPFIRNGDMSIDQFKEWFPKDFLAHVENFYSCGNYGDPAFAKDCLEIYAYVRECNPDARLAIHTNGGMRDPKWWSKLPQYNIEVIFAVDGFKGKHELYRKNTKFDKVIENMRAFIDAGGRAKVDSLVFAHNEYDVEELEEYLLGLGVESVNFVSTTRFYEMDAFPVQDENGNHLYDLNPAQRLQFKRIPNNTLNALVDKNFRDKILEESVINPICENEEGIYVDPYGNILPCCWIGSDYIEEPVEEVLPIHYLRNISVENVKEIMNTIGVPKCQDGVLGTDTILFEELNNYWQGKNKCMTCAKICSKSMYNNRKNNA